MIKIATFADFVSVARSLKQTHIGEDTFEGVYEIEDVEALDILLSCLSESDRSGIDLIAAAKDDLEIGQSIKVRMTHPQLGFGIFAPHIASLLKNTKARIEEPKRYYIVNLNFSSLDDLNEPEIIKRYRTILELINIITRSAAHLDKDSATLLFIDKSGKFEIPVDYSENEVFTLKIEAVAKLRGVVAEDVQLDQRLSMFSNAICDLLAPVHRKDRFRYLVSHLDELFEKFEAAYKLFLASFSYDKIRDEIEDARVEYIGKIHKTFSDIQNQILGIPLAAVILATQMKSANNMGYEVWINVGVLSGSWIFVSLIFFLIRNQLHTLDVIKQEIARQRHKMETEYSPIAGQFIDVFNTLACRLRSQRYMLSMIDIIAVIVLIVTHIVFFQVTAPASAWLKGVVDVAQKFIMLTYC